MTFKVLLLEQSSRGDITATVRALDEAQLPDGEVTVAVDYSSLNYKDALCLTGKGGLVRSYPHVAGIDLAGMIEASADPRYKPGDRVLATGWRIGETRWGGYAGKARVKADWLVPLPDSLSAREAMAIGTAGLTAMLALLALEAHGMAPDRGEVLVTGASGGVGSIATALLAQRGYRIAAVTGKAESEPYLKALGAARIVKRAEIAEVAPKPLESESWAGCVDAVGGAMLARILGQMKYGAAIAAVGLAGGAALPASVIPFLLRGIALLGIDSVLAPYEKRLAAWRRLAADLPRDRLAAMSQVVGLADLPRLGQAILAGQVRGRVVIDVRA